MLIGSTNSLTPFDSNTWSPSPPFSSIIRPYWKPEHPPPCTKTRRPLFCFCSSARSSVDLGRCGGRHVNHLILLGGTRILLRKLYNTGPSCRPAIPTHYGALPTAQWAEIASKFARFGPRGRAAAALAEAHAGRLESRWTGSRPHRTDGCSRFARNGTRGLPALRN